MFAAFGRGDVDGFVATVSDDTQIIPKGVSEGKEGVREFFNNVVGRTEMINFEPQQFVVEGNTVVVLGREHQRVKRSGRELKQQRVQIYTVENGSITRMEEFATSEEVDQSV